jgi:hypothetical protein
MMTPNTTLPTSGLQRNFSVILWFGVAAGFLGMLVELLLMGHAQGSQLISVVACIAGVVLAVLGLSGRASRNVSALFLVLALSGLYGAAVHRAERVERIAEVEPAAKLIESAAGADSGEAKHIAEEAIEKFAGFPPLLAPLGLSGLSMLGALAVWSRRE